MKVHYLKTVQPYFNDVWMKRKTFELRKNDREFEVGDIVVLMEYNKETDSFTANQVHGLITYILSSYHNALNEPYVIFSFIETNRLCNFLNITP